MSSEGTANACRRCGQTPYIILDKVHIECQNCYVESSTRKFRQAFGKAKLVYNYDSLLLAYSGGQSSAALLDMIKTRVDSSYGLEPKCRPSIIHIDMQSVISDESLATSASQRLKNLSRLLNDLTVTYESWPIYWTSIEMCMKYPCDKNCYQSYKKDADLSAGNPLLCDELAYLEFQDAIKQAGDLTDQQRFVDHQCMDLIDRVTHNINLNAESHHKEIKYVLVGSSSTRLASGLLVDVILGEGSTIRSAISALDERPHVPVLRLLRDFSKKEIVFYLKAKNIEFSTQPNLLTKADRKACIQTVTEAFLSKLNVDYPSTYNTLMKTGDKLA